MPAQAWFKYFLRSVGLWYPLARVRQTKAVIWWIAEGCPSPPPHVVKLHAVRSYCRRFELRKFIETGTYIGETTEWMARTGIDVLSIELDHNLYRRAQARLKRYPNVTLIHGDSGQVLPELLSRLNQPACFWLDAHWSGGITGKGACETPIMQEVNAILAQPIRGHVVLIDDARCFEGANGYPHLDELLSTVRVSGNYQAEVSADVIRMVPGETNGVP